MARFPGAAWKPLPRNFSPGARTAQLGLILHVQAGNGELSGWFSNPSAQASSTFWVSKTGQIYQYMEAGADKSWAQAAGNGLYDSVETEGVPSEPLTDAQVAALAALVRWEHETYGMPYTVINTPGARGFGWHGMGGAAWGGHTGCPGDLRRAQMQHIIDVAQSGTQEDDMTPDQDKALARILQILEVTDVTIHDRWRVRRVSFEWISPRAAFHPRAIRSTQKVLPRPSEP